MLFSDALIKYFEYINSLKPKDNVDYAKCRQLFESYLKSEGVNKNSKIEFTQNKKRKANKVDDSSKDDAEDTDEETPKKVLKKNTTKQNGDLKPIKRRKKTPTKAVVTEENSENEEPDESIQKVKKSRVKKRKSSEPSVLVKVKKTKLAPKATPPAKKNHTNIATQTSVEKPKENPRQVSFDSPICEIIGEKKPVRGAKVSKSPNSSGDIFDDSFTIEEKRIRPKRNLLSDEEVIVKRVVRKKVTTVKPQAKSWKNTPAVLNGRSPPK